MALAAGVDPKIVGERLGQSNIQITLDTYPHVLAGLQGEAAEQVADLILNGQLSGDTSDSTPPLSASDEALEGPLPADAEGVAPTSGQAQQGVRVIPLRPTPG